MINFRFHVVSLAAVFLALALGITMGATVIDRAIVNGLQDRIDTVEKNTADRRRENDELREEIGRLSGYVTATQRHAVANQLSGIPVIVMVAPGVDGGLVDQVVAELAAADSATRGVLWFEQRWTRTAQGDIDALAAAIGLAPGEESDTLRHDATAVLARRLANGHAPRISDTPQPLGASGIVGSQDSGPTGSTGSAGLPVDGVPILDPSAPLIDPLAALIEAGFLRFEATSAGNDDIEAFPGSNAVLLVITEPGADALVGRDLVDTVAVSIETGLAVVAAEVFTVGNIEDPGIRGAELSWLRSEGDLWGQISTVDNLETVEGRVAIIWAIVNHVHGLPGHYGTGAGADSEFPKWIPN